MTMIIRIAATITFTLSIIISGAQIEVVFYMAIKSAPCTIHGSRKESVAQSSKGYGMSSLLKVPAPHLNNIPNNSCLTRTTLNKKEYRVIVQLEEKMSEGQGENRVRKVGEESETHEKDLNQLKWSKSIGFTAARKQTEWLLLSSRVSLTATFHLETVTQVQQIQLERASLQKMLQVLTGE